MKKILTGFGKSIAVFAFMMFLTVAALAQVSLRKALDSDGDNKADFSIFRPSDNTWYILKSGGGFIAQPFGVSTTDIMTPGDYDGDGKADISVWRDTNGAWYRFNSSDNTFYAIAFGTTGDEPVARDYDGDGKTDVAVVRRTGGALIWYALRSTNGSLFAVAFGASATDYVAPGDYDGDGKFDVAVQRTGANFGDQAIFYILRSGDGGLTAVAWGLSSDMVVPGDYDGDGKTDVAVIRAGSTPESNLVWYALKSSDGGLIAVTFGLTGGSPAIAGDLNAQNDYDGDGKTDIAVWRDSDGTFYFLRSTDGSVGVVKWGSPGDFPISSYDTH